MPRPRHRTDTENSLFPFLSVLACAIGVLIVIIGGQNLIALGSSDQIIEVTGTLKGKTPVYVECDRDGIVIHPEGLRVPLTELHERSPSIRRWTPS